MTSKVKRRLTTILCADVEGYSRLMEADEVGTLAMLQRYRAAMATLIERHDGRIVNTWGDALIAEFPSVVEAVQCAVETQQELSDQNDALPDAQRMRFRIGINLGDVMVEGDDVYGDGVNVAARLQQIAEAGGILISGPVYDQVRNKLAIGFAPLGEQQVKNVASPVMSYRVIAGNEEGQPVEQRRYNPLGMKSSNRNPILRLWDWYLRLPRRIAVILAICVFLFLINAFTGFRDIWFHWPVMSLLLIALLSYVFSRKSS